MHQAPPQTVPLRPDGLQLDERRDYQNRHWRAERIAWGGFGLLVVAALSGLTGAGGPLATASLTIGPAAVEMPRVGRLARADLLTIRLPETPELHDIRLGPGFSDHYALGTLHPRPRAEATGPEGTVLTVTAAGGEVRLQARPHRPGLARFTLAIDGQERHLAALVLP